MNRHGERYLRRLDFQAHCRALHLTTTGAELDYYADHGLLVPLVCTYEPPEVAAKRVGAAQPGKSDEARVDTWMRLLGYGSTSLDHPFDDEGFSNPFLAWGNEPKDLQTRFEYEAQGRTLCVPLVESYYGYWQAYQLARVKARGYWENQAVLRELPPESSLRTMLEPPTDHSQLAPFPGSERAFQALTFFHQRTSSQFRRWEARKFRDRDAPAPTADEREVAFDEIALDISTSLGFDTQELAQLLWDLTRLRERYQRDERMALAESVYRDLTLAFQFGAHAFKMDWDAIVGLVRSQLGDYPARAFARLSPLTAYNEQAIVSLSSVIDDIRVNAIRPNERTTAETAREILAFCEEQDLLEVITALAGYTYTPADWSDDRLPGFLFRRLRPLSIAAEQFTRTILDLRGQGTGSKTLNPLLRDVSRDFPRLSSLLEQRSPLTRDHQASFFEQASELDTLSHDWVDAEGSTARAFLLTCLARNASVHSAKLWGDDEAATEIGTLAHACISTIVRVWWIAADRRTAGA